MKKIIFFVLSLVLTLQGMALAQQQIDAGQTRGQTDANRKFFVARNGRVAAISADRVVIWDSTSNDGVSVTTTTTSWDSLVAGVTIDAIPGITSDVTAVNSGGGGINWGRVQVYGRHVDVSWDNGMTALPNGCLAGNKVAAHSVAGQATAFRLLSADSATTGGRISTDSLGIALEDCAAGNKSLDIFIQKG